MNQCQLIGRIASDISYQPCNKDRSVRKFALAFKEARKVNGEDDSYFIDCEAWDAVGERIDKFCKKGDLVGISGRLIQHKYVRADGSKASRIIVVVSSIEFLQPKKVEEEPKEEVEDDELPF